MRGHFGPASTKEASNKPSENRGRRLKFNSDTIEHFVTVRIFSSGWAGRPPLDAAVCQGRREDRRSHNNETVILLTKTMG